MKKFFVLLLALTVLLTGCQKSEKIDCEFHNITLSTSWSNVIELEISEDNKIEQKLDYKAWYCGHWHINKRIDRMHFLFGDYEIMDQL